MHWLSENYKWLFDGVAGAAAIAIIGYVIHRFLGPKGQQQAALTAQGAKVENSPVASGTNISQTINSPTVNMSLAAPTPGAPGRERYNEWRELIDEIHESLRIMANAFAYRPPPGIIDVEEREDYRAGIHRGNRILDNRILIADAVQKAGLKKDWDELVQYAHSGRGPVDRWQQGSPTMGGFDKKAREFQEKLMRIARQDMSATADGPAPTVVAPKTERPVPNIVYAGAQRKLVFISPSQREGICDPRTQDERTNSVEAFVLKFENRVVRGRKIGRALNVIAKIKFRHKNGATERDIDYGVWLNSPCNSTDMGVGDTREVVLMCVVDNQLLTFEDRRTDHRFLDAEGFAYIKDGEVEDYDRVDITIIDQNSQASLHTKLKVWREGASFFSSEL